MAWKMVSLRQSSALRELRVLHKDRDVAALRQLFRLRGGELARASGVDEGRLVALAGRTDGDVAAGTSRVLELVRNRSKQQREDDGLDRARNAVEQLQATVRWHNDHGYLDKNLVLGDLLAAPRKYIKFEVGGQSFLVSRIRLARFRPIARGLDGLQVFVSEYALSFRWRGGRGGLDFYVTNTEPVVPSDVLIVRLEMPPRRTANIGFWGDVLDATIAYLKPFVMP